MKGATITMAGREDYEERKQMKKAKYKKLSEKARKRSQEYSNKFKRISNSIPSRATYISRA